jgi:hypothetical protein
MGQSAPLRPSILLCVVVSTSSLLPSLPPAPCGENPYGNPGGLTDNECSLALIPKLVLP